MILTPLDMHILIDQKIQSMGMFAYQGLEHEEIDLQINHQIDLFIEAVVDKYKKKRPRIGVKEGFQENQVRLDDLRTIHVKDYTTSLTNYNTDGKQFNLPDNYSHHLKSKVITSYTCLDENKKTVTKTITTQLRIGETENIENMRLNPFYKTTKESPLAELVNNTMYIYTDGFDITNVYTDYIKKPAVVKYAKDSNGDYDSLNSVTCDLPHTVHRTIVDMTCIEIMKIIEANPQKINNLEEETI